MTFSVHGISVGQGLGGAANGVATGRAVKIVSSRTNVAHYFITADQVQAELDRVRIARDAAVREMMSASKEAPQELSAIMDVHLMLLQDETLADGVRHFIEERHYNAEWALGAQLEVIAAQFDEVHDPYMRERKRDLEQVVERLIAQLTDARPQRAFIQQDHSQHESLILIAHDLSPADMIHFKGDVFSGFVTDVGGKTSHTAIVARSMGIPAIVGAKSASHLVRHDDWVIVDADAGVLIVDPTTDILAQYQQKQSDGLVAWQAHLANQSKNAMPAALLADDGTAITVLANIELPSDAAAALAAGAQGIGLFRTEFLFMGRAELPDEDEQYAAYRDVVLAMKGLPVTIRTIDIGADKPLDARHGYADSQPNPALGLRAIRWCLAEPAMFLTQLRALLRAAVHGRIEVLIPMLAHESEIKQCLLMLERARLQMGALDVPYGEIGLGAMIEVPAAALIVPIFLKYFDFLSIGSNDLTQYTLAVDRADESVAHLYDAMHPAVQFLIESTIKQCNAAGKPISVCGEIAGDESHTQSLLAMGLRRFSMHPTQMANFRRAIKK
ncbi:MAG: phosphoenolpyruvate--protein phosphotransferase [Cytophagales bacterium]|nr:phosphoenolpyruvate--protein phosphotransferase [Cytophagales bacterium]